MKKAISIILIIFLIIFMQVNISYADDSIDDVMGSAEEFIRKGEASSPIDKDSLKGTTDLLYNLLLGFAIAVAVGVGVMLGIKYMTGSLDEKAVTKQQLIGYVISCVVVFGAFGIWALAVNILSAI